MKKFYILLIALFMINGANGQWVPLNSGTNFTFRSVNFVNADIGCAVGYNGYNGFSEILKTTNGGIEWTHQSSGSYTGGLHSVNFATDDTGYTVGMGGGIYVIYSILKTTNGGTDWIEQLWGYGLHSVYFTDANTGYAVGNDGAIVKTTDGGTNWITQNSGVTAILHSVYFPSADTGYAVGENGTILKTTNGGLPVGINDNATPESHIAIFPNPTSTTITIKPPTTPDKNSIMTIFNISGQQLIQHQVTEQQTVVDVSGLPKGVYVVKVADDRTVMVGKFVKQ